MDKTTRYSDIKAWYLANLDQLPYSVHLETGEIRFNIPQLVQNLMLQIDTVIKSGNDPRKDPNAKRAKALLITIYGELQYKEGYRDSMVTWEEYAANGYKFL